MATPSPLTPGPIQYGPYNQTSSRYRPPAQMGPSGGPQPFDMAAMLQAFVQLAQIQAQAQQAGQAQGAAADLTAQRELQSGRHLGMSGIDVSDEAAAGPWGGPLKFPSAEERYAQMAKYPAVSVPPRNDFSNPYFAGPIPGSERVVGTTTPSPVTPRPSPTPAPTRPGNFGVKKKKGSSFGFGAGIGPR